MNNLLVNLENAKWSKEQFSLNNVKSNINKNSNILKNSKFEKMLNEKTGRDGKIDIKKLSTREKKLYNSCVELESFLWKNVLNAMRKTINKYKLIDGGPAEDIFTDFLYDEHSMIMAKTSSSNLSTVMFKQLSKNL